MLIIQLAEKNSALTIPIISIMALVSQNTIQSNQGKQEMQNQHNDTISKLLDNISQLIQSSNSEKKYYKEVLMSFVDYLIGIKSNKIMDESVKQAMNCMLTFTNEEEVKSEFKIISCLLQFIIAKMLASQTDTKKNNTSKLTDEYVKTTENQVVNSSDKESVDRKVNLHDDKSHETIVVPMKVSRILNSVSEETSVPVVLRSYNDKVQPVAPNNEEMQKTPTKSAQISSTNEKWGDMVDDEDVESNAGSNNESNTESNIENTTELYDGDENEVQTDVKESESQKKQPTYSVVVQSQKKVQKYEDDYETDQSDEPFRLVVGKKPSKDYPEVMLKFAEYYDNIDLSQYAVRIINPNPLDEVKWYPDGLKKVTSNHWFFGVPKKSKDTYLQAGTINDDGVTMPIGWVTYTIHLNDIQVPVSMSNHHKGFGHYYFGNGWWITFKVITDGNNKPSYQLLKHQDFIKNLRFNDEIALQKQKQR